MAFFDRTNGYTGDVAVKIPCRCATTTNITLTGFQTIDEVTPVSTDSNLRILVKDQTDQTENGIYVMSSNTWVRAADFDGLYDIVRGTTVGTQEGTTNGNRFYQVDTSDPITIGTSAITFVETTFSIEARTLRLELANAGASESLGSALVGWVQSGSGAALRTLLSKGRDTVSVLDYGVIPDDNTAAAANTTALRKLVSSVANGGVFSYGGTIAFPLGRKYYLSGIIPIKDGVHFDLCGSTLDFTAADSASENQAGFLYARRDVSVRNGHINVDYTGGISGRGSAIKMGARPRDTDQAPGNYFLDNFEEWQSGTGAPMPVMPGNIELKNLRISSNNPNAPIIQLLGGLKGVKLENIWLDGQGLTTKGIDYEFGNANPNGDNPGFLNPHLWSSSHGRDFSFRNINVSNVNGTGIDIRGAYNVSLNGLFADTVSTVLSIGTGEAANYNPGDEDVAGVKYNFRAANIVGQNVTGNAIVVDGNTEWTGYLSPLATQTQTDVEAKTTGLLNAVIENFRLVSNGAGGAGVACAANNIILRNGSIEGFTSAILDTGTRHFIVDNVDQKDNTIAGTRLTVGSLYVTGWTDRTFVLINSEVAGNGAGAGYGVLFESGQVNAVLENNVFGYNNRATGSITITGGTSGVSTLDSLKVNGVEILSGPVTAGVDTTATATAIAANINAHTSSPNYTAKSYGAKVLIRALLGTGATPNSYVVLPDVSGGVTVGSIKDMSGGASETNQLYSVSVASGITDVVVRNNNTRAVAPGGVAYRHQDLSTTRCLLSNNYGLGNGSTGGWGIIGSAMLDEDDLASDSATHTASQQSVKAYVDSVPSILGSTAGNTQRRFMLRITTSGTDIICQIFLAGGLGFNSTGFMSTSASAAFTKGGNATVGTGAEAVTYSLSAGGETLTVNFVEAVTCWAATPNINSTGTAVYAYSAVAGGNATVQFTDPTTGVNVDLSALTTGKLIYLQCEMIVGGTA